MNLAEGGLELQQSQMTKINFALKYKIKNPQSCKILILKFQDFTYKCYLIQSNRILSKSSFKNKDNNQFLHVD